MYIYFKFEMLETQFLIFFLIFSVPSSFCFFDDVAKADVSAFELNGLIHETVFVHNKFHMVNGVYKFCNDMCDDLWYKRSCGELIFPDRTPCNGQFPTARNIAVRKACILKEGPRKFAWINTLSLGLLGDQTQSCPEDKGELLFKSEFMGYKSYYYGACSGQCFEDGWTVYLGRLKSRESQNYVIVGVRFILKNKTLFLQPAQGKLGTDGQISNVSWISLPEVIPGGKFGKVNLTYHSFFLDDLKLDPQYALTGIKFYVVKRGNENPIGGFAISISGRLLDPRQGTLNLTSAHSKTVKARRSGVQTELPLNLVRPSSEEILKCLKPSPGNYTYVKLQQSDLFSDVGQSTLPLFESTPVILQEYSILSGIRVFHKGSGEHAGFISLQLRPISYNPYLRALMEEYRGNGTKL